MEKSNVFLSPVPELALFFGMISAETDGPQVGLSSWGQRCGSALTKAISLQTREVLLYSEQCPLPYMVFTWDWTLSEGVSESDISLEALQR